MTYYSSNQVWEWCKTETPSVFFAALASPFGRGRFKAMNSNRSIINNADVLIYLWHLLVPYSFLFLFFNFARGCVCSPETARDRESEKAPCYFSLGSKLKILFFSSMGPLISFPRCLHKSHSKCILHSVQLVSLKNSKNQSTKKKSKLRILKISVFHLIYLCCLFYT